MNTTASQTFSPHDLHAEITRGARASRLRLLLASCFLLWVAFGLTTAAEPLPEGPGLAGLFAQDKGIAQHPSVIFAENFEAGSLEEIQPRWNEIENPEGKVLALDGETSESSGGRHSLKVTAALGKNTGGHLFKRLAPAQEKVFARFYVKFAEKASYLHHFAGLGGYRPATNWPQGHAGKLAPGDQRFSVGIEPTGYYGTQPPPGAWIFYTYWCEMKQSADGGYWGNALWPDPPSLAQAGRWQCVEVMLKCNAADKSDGELALWLDGRLTMHIAPGTRHGRWTGEGFRVLPGGGEAFPGFRWRTHPELAITYFQLSHFVTADSYRANKVENPPPTNTVWFDDVILAKEYIGPMTKKR